MTLHPEAVTLGGSQRSHFLEEPPYGVIWDQLKDGEVIPFLGAGASLCGRPQNDDGEPLAWTGSESSFLPNGSELGEWLAEKCRFPDPTGSSDLAKVASYYEIRARRRLLVRRLRDVFGKDYAFGAIHQFLAASPRPLLIVTTNYDDLLERAFQTQGRPYHLVTHPERDEFAASVLWWKPGATEPVTFTPRELPLSLTDTSIIYKMHGSVNALSEWNSFVITEEDYVRFLSRMTEKVAIPARFMVHFKDSSFLFLGYGLRDWNLRVMLENLHRSFRIDRRETELKLSTEERKLGAEDAVGEMLGRFTRDATDMPSWAIQDLPSHLERTLWMHRNVQIFDMKLDAFVARMRQLRS
jgi:hypothetical protein